MVIFSNTTDGSSPAKLDLNIQLEELAKKIVGVNTQCIFRSPEDQKQERNTIECHIYPSVRIYANGTMSIVKPKGLIIKRSKKCIVGEMALTTLLPPSNSVGVLSVKSYVNCSVDFMIDYNLRKIT